METKIVGDFVYLHDVPFYDQSSQDDHCGYYCAIMMLVAVCGGDAWKAWWAEQLEPKSEDALQLDKGGFVVETLQSYLQGNERDEKYRLQTELVRIKDTGADKFLKKIKDALFDGRPSILRLPYSFHHPYGHYVVVKGYINTDGKGCPQKQQLIVNDPLVGEISLGISAERLASDLEINGNDDVYGAVALISTQRTCLFKEEKQTQVSDAPPDSTE